ncbi:MAG TPA: hypothetical protein VFY71_10095 [Planctomycetota bacterium]|nr:hypothetical protein [Planctomycetota bacterium]
MCSDYSSTVDGRTRTHATHPQLVNGLPRLPEADRWTHYDHCPVWVDLPIAALT